MAENALDEHYPQTCPFCDIAAAYPSAASTSSTSSSPSLQTPVSSPSHRASHATLSTSTLLRCVPSPSAADPEKVQPAAFVVLSAPEVLAFLDIMPMTRGHLLVTTRAHRGKVADVRGEEGRDVGFWLPLLARTVSKVTGVTDYNIVQNNGPRAAQVVPHVHFHIIPRPAAMPELQNKSWTMFGRGQREDLDDDEAVELAGEMRTVLREEVEALDGGQSKL